MYRVIGKIIKQNVADSFYSITDSLVTEDIRLHWVQEYKETRKCISIDVVISENQLELQTTQLWESQQSYLDYKNDATLISGLFSVRDAYWAEHGITGVIVTEESI